MFTVDEIKTIQSKVKSGADFPNYVQELIALGVTGYENYVSDGRTFNFGKNNFKIQSDAKYSSLIISEISNKTEFISDLKSHQQGNTSYSTFCEDSAKQGVEKWIVDTVKMTCTYYNKMGNEMLVEKIPVQV